jgi:hypothetical protein
MIPLIRAVCSLGGLIGVFFGAFYLFDGQYALGSWAVIAGFLFLFIGDTVMEIDVTDDDDNDKYA